jgi:hypothetical protein
MGSRIPAELREDVNRELERDGYEGHLVDDEAEPAEVREMLDFLRDHADEIIRGITANDSRQPNIYYDFVEDSRFNAVALGLDSDYFILANTRTVFEIPNVFRNLFALPEFASQIGDPSLETHNAPQPWMPQADADVFDLIAEQRLPNCPVRNRAAATFSRTAMEFLLLHELSHIRNGHLHYLGGEAPAHLTEAERELIKEQEAVVQHTIEIDADSHAVVLGANRALPLAGSTQATGDRLYEQLYATPESTLYAYMLPIYVLFRCFSRGQWAPEAVWKRSHPPPAIRAYLLPALIDKILARRGQPYMEVDTIYSIAIQIVREAERCLSVITGNPANLGDFALASRQWPTYGRQINECWIEAYPHLDKLKLGGTLAPPEPWRDHG